MASRWLMTFGALGLLACSAPLDRNPAQRCAAENECPLELTCYRGYCVERETADGRGVSVDPVDSEAGVGDGQSDEASDAGGSESDAAGGGSGADESDATEGARDAGSLPTVGDAGPTLEDSQVPSAPAEPPEAEPAPPATEPPASEPAPPPTAPAAPPDVEPPVAEPTPPSAEPPGQEPAAPPAGGAAEIEAWTQALREAGLPEEALLCVPSCVFGDEKGCRKCVERMLKGQEDAERCDDDDDDDDDDDEGSRQRAAVCALLDCGSQGCGRRP